MKTLAILSQKGGAGKSTLARGFAVAACFDGRAVAILDMDPQQTCAHWAARRALDAPAVLTADPASFEARWTEARDRRAGLCVIDTPPHVRTAVQQTAQRADGIVIPVQPSPDDLDALPATLAIAEAVGKPVVIVVNRAPVRAQAAAMARERIAELGVPVLPHDITDRIAHAYASAAGQTAQEYEPSGKAAAEMAKAWIFIRKSLAI
jgi:chromosome partitioning protein